MPDPVLLTSNDGLIVFVNPAAETLYAYSSAELSRKPLSLIAPTLSGAIIEEMVRASPDGKWETETVGARKGGDRFPAKLNVSSITDRGGSYLGSVCTVHDLTELSRLRDDLSRGGKELTVLARIGRITSSNLNINQVYVRVAYEVRQLIPCDIISVGAVDRESGTVTYSYVTGLGVPEREQGTTIEIQGSIAEKVLLEATGVLFQPGDEDEVARSFPALTRVYDAGVRSFLAVPLIADRVVGVLQLGSCEVRAFGQRSLEVAGWAASQIAGAVFNAWLSAELEKSQRATAQSERSRRELFDSAPVCRTSAIMGHKWEVENPRV